MSKHYSVLHCCCLLVLLGETLVSIEAAPVPAPDATTNVPFEQYDTDQDGQLEEPELRKTMKEKMKDSPKALIPLDKFKLLVPVLETTFPMAKGFGADLDAADTNGDGLLSMDEYIAETVKLTVRNMDKNGDGVVSKAENEEAIASKGFGFGRKRK